MLKLKTLQSFSIPLCLYPPLFNHPTVLVTRDKWHRRWTGLAGEISFCLEKKHQLSMLAFQKHLPMKLPPPAPTSGEKFLCKIQNEERLLLRSESSRPTRKKIHLGVLKTWCLIKALQHTLTICFQLGNANNTYLMGLLEKLNEIMSMKALCKLQVLAVTIMIIPQMLS